MATASRSLYTGNGSTKVYAVTFPFISSSHVDVYVNDALFLDPLHYSLSGSTVTFIEAPLDSDAISIRRNTSPNALLVDFHDGSVLGEAELDMQYQHNFYLQQEVTDSYNQLVNEALINVATGAGIVETETDEVIAALVNEMLETAAADELNQRVTDIDNNAAAIITNASTITTISDTVDGVSARYGVALSVNGYVTGFLQHNDGESGIFVILADKFAVVDPSGDPAEPQYVPFEISGGKINITGDVTIDGDLLVSGTINGLTKLSTTEAHRIGSTQIGADAITTTQLNASAVTAAKIASSQITATHISGTQLDVLAATTGTLEVDESLTMNAAGHMKGGQTAYDTGAGFWLGYDSSAYKFSIGDGADQSLTWDGTTLTIRGDLEVGEYVASDVVILTAATERSDFGEIGPYTTYKTFEIDKSGQVKLTWEGRANNVTDNITYPSYQILRNSSIIVGPASLTSTSYNTKTHTIGGLAAGDTISIQLKGGSRVPAEPIESTAYCKDAEIKADIVFNAGGSVILD